LQIENGLNTVEQICGGCERRETKPTELPPGLERWISRLSDLRLLKEAGAVYEYPAALLPDEWDGLRAWQAAVADFEQEKAERERERERVEEAVRRNRQRPW
jgi:hypothetical protein